jgi:hypothetical protein
LILGIAVWVKFGNEVLLQQKILQRGEVKIVYFEPFKGWLKNKEFVKDALRRIMKENIEFCTDTRLHFREIVREIFGIPGKGTAVRYHFVVEVPYNVNILRENVRLIGEKDLEKVKKMNEKGKNFQKDIILFDNDYNVLLQIFPSFLFFKIAIFI